MADWSNTELQATVRAYLQMLEAQRTGAAYSKADFRRKLIKGPLAGRSEASVEFRMRNISAVMEQHRQPLLKGYVPAKNVGPEVTTRLWKIIQAERRTAQSQLMPNPPGKARKPIGSKLAQRPPIIYFNIGWMKEYRGTVANDPTLGGHGFLSDHRHGAEAFNFLPTADAMLRGYRPGHANRLAISRLGAARGETKLEGVLVIWMAREPVSKRTMIVGWYDNATVYERARPGSRQVSGEAWPYSVEARASDAHLVPALARTFWIQSARTTEDGFGQSPTWYGSDGVNDRVWRYVQRVRAGSWAPKRSLPGKSKPPRNADPELRVKVEKAAVQHATAYFESPEGGGCTVDSVEVLGRGWDLGVSNGQIDLLVEVKGLQGSELVCELTPNEYSKMMLASNRKRYVVYVVNNALTAPLASIFKHLSGDTWQTEDGRALKIEPRTGAVLRCP